MLGITKLLSSKASETVRTKKRIWIAWETQRRSIEMSKKVNAKLFIFDFFDRGILRYPLCFIKTIFTLMRERPDVLFVQNPSMFLATLACVYGMVSGVYVVVDRHTTFRLNKPHSGSFKIWGFMRLHYFTLRTADLTIVTNDFLAKLVEEVGGRPFVLPDALPTLEPTETYNLDGKANLLLISSFASDEPIQAVLESMKNIDAQTHLYITGNYKKMDPDLNKKVPNNVHLLGFVSEQTFTNMLFSVDVVLALTTAECCMLCGCYEAVTAAKPLITSDKTVLKNYFDGALFVNNSKDDISCKIKEAVDTIEKRKHNASLMKTRIGVLWQSNFQRLNDLLNA